MTDGRKTFCAYVEINLNRQKEVADTGIVTLNLKSLFLLLKRKSLRICQVKYGAESPVWLDIHPGLLTLLFRKNLIKKDRSKERREGEVVFTPKQIWRCQRTPKPLNTQKRHGSKPFFFLQSFIFHTNCEFCEFT